MEGRGLHAARLKQSQSGFCRAEARFFSYKRLLVSDYVDGVQAFRALLAFKIDSISFVQGLESVFLNSGKVNEYILPR